MIAAHPLLADLNPSQREAVTRVGGPLLVLAGAGSGKTRVITHRIAWLIRELGVAPWEIFAATFTNKAAEEMRRRVEHLVPGAQVARLSIGTFHSLCVGILRREADAAGLSPRFAICDEHDQMALVKDCLRHLALPPSVLRPERALGWIGAAKTRMLAPDEAARAMATEDAPLCARVYRLYQQRLRASDAVDFDDLLNETVRIFRERPDVLARYRQRWRHVLIDEYQDTNKAQFELARLLAGEHGNICAVGDEDQSIYSWRGADIENLLRFPDVFPGAAIIPLEQNYRSRQIILQAASAVIAHNRRRHPKRLWSERGPGEPITLIVGATEREEAALLAETIERLRAQGHAWRDMAVFYRINALSRSFEDQLRGRSIPYRVVGGIRFYDRAEIKDALAYLRLAVNPRDGLALARIVNKPPRGIGEKSLAILFNEAARRGVALWDVIAGDEASLPAGVSGRAREGLAELVASIRRWEEAAPRTAPHELLERILDESGYQASLGKADDGDLDALARRENLSELVTALRQFADERPGAALEDFLERVALISAPDEITGEDAVSLMTLHCAKGLEFDVVFLVGLEDGIFPNRRALAEARDLEEERRLFYVGVTRARELLFLARADSRMHRGRFEYNPPSQFLHEVPLELTRTLDDAWQTWGRRAAPSRRAGEPRAPRLREADAAAGPFAVGARVRHRRLGEGRVRSVRGHGQGAMVLVEFDAGVRLEIQARPGALEPVDEEKGLPF